MAKGDGKDRFFRTLNFDEDTRKLIKFFRKIKQQMINEAESKDDKK